MGNAHTAQDLAQMQSLPLEAKIRMTKERIKTWYESWSRFEIYNAKSKKNKVRNNGHAGHICRTSIKGK